MKTGHELIICLYHILAVFFLDAAMFLFTSLIDFNLGYVVNQGLPMVTVVVGCLLAIVTLIITYQSIETFILVGIQGKERIEKKLQKSPYIYLIWVPIQILLTIVIWTIVILLEKRFTNASLEPGGNYPFYFMFEVLFLGAFSVMIIAKCLYRFGQEKKRRRKEME